MKGSRPMLLGAAVAVCAALPAALPTAGASFTASAAGTGSMQADTVASPTGFTATRVCSTTPIAVAVSQADGTGPSLSVPRPDSVEQGDLVVLVVAAPPTAGPWSSDGWSYYGGEAAKGATLVGKVATAAEPASYTVNGLVDGQASRAVLLVYRGVDPDSPWTGVLGQSNDVASTTVTGGAFTVWSPDPADLLVSVAVVPSYAGSIVAAAPWETVAEASPSDGLPSTVLVADRDVVQNTGYAFSGTISAARTSYVMEFALRPTGAAWGAVELAWTPSVDLNVDGYGGYRSDNPAATSWVPGRSTAGYTDTSLPAGVGATYTLWATVGSWASAPVSASVDACP